MIDEARYGVQAEVRTILAEDYNGYLIMNNNKEYIICTNTSVRTKGIFSLFTTERLSNDIPFEKVLEYIDKKGE